MMKLKEAQLKIEQLLLDPNNYRFQDAEDYVQADERRFHEKSVQDRAFKRLRDDTLLQLKTSVLTNGLLPVERLVVYKYPHDNDHYVVVEGNRRVAALKWIAEDYAAGVAVSDSVLESLADVPVLVAPDSGDPAFREALMGVRHVSGIKPWGGYQSAKLVATLRDKHGIDSGEIAGRLGMSTQEVNRRYRAYKALEQMIDDDEYGDYALPSM